MSKKSEIISQEAVIGVIRSAFGAVPFAGTLLNEVFFDIRMRVKQKRFEEFVDILSDRIHLLEESGINKNTITSEEFSDYLESMIQKVVRNRSREKMELYADLLASAMSSDNIADLDDRDMYLTIISSLSSPEFKILKKFHDYFKDVQKHEARGEKLEMGALDYAQSTIYGLPTKDAQISIESLVSKGLAVDDSMNRIGTRPRTFIIPSVLATHLMDFIEAEMEKITPRG